MSRLEKLGWKEELEYMSSKEPHPLFQVKSVRQPRPLTDKIWDTIEEEVVAFMHDKKQERLLDQHKALLKGRYWMLSQFWNEFGRRLCYRLPKCRYAASLPVIKALLESPSDVEITDKSFKDAEIEQQILEQFADLQEEQHTMLRQWVQKDSGLRLSPESKVALEDLAIMSCLNENKLSHTFDVDEDFFGAHDSYGSPFKRHNDKAKVDSDKNCYESFMDEIAGERLWSSTSMMANWELIQWVIRQAGEDPATVTTERMDKKKIRFFCNNVCGSDNVRVIMNWRRAVSPFTGNLPRHRC